MLSIICRSLGLLALAVVCTLSPDAQGSDAPPIRGQIDWQAHPAMHIPWTMFGRGLTQRPLKRRTWRHTFRQTVSAPTLAASEVRILLAAAMAAERARNPQQARRLILKQFAYIENFVRANPDRYVLATTPQQAREALLNTDKTVLVHSIEGGHHLLWDTQDARFWAAKGVALFTLIHLRDKEFGGAAILDRSLGPLINPAGAQARRRGERRGLTAHGKKSLLALNQAGILVDYSHMSPDAIHDALALSAEHGFSPVMTHNRLSIVTDDEFGISEAQLVELYRQGGVFSLGLSALEIQRDRVHTTFPDDLCWGTLEAWAWQHQLVQDTLRKHITTVFEDPQITEDTLTEEQKTQLATGWSSDWNGWVSHSAPVYGRHRCRNRDDATLSIDTVGLAHPGLLPQHWQRVREQGVSLDPMLRSAERFLQLWEQAHLKAKP